jgi:hypothetical protein
LDVLFITTTIATLGRQSGAKRPAQSETKIEFA